MNEQRVKKILRKHYGNFETFLDREYENKIVDKLITEDYSGKHEWATYNQLLLELKHNLKNLLLAKEMQYRLTDNENPNSVCIDIIEKANVQTNELKRLYEKIVSFILNP